jgi:DNA-3-methyladenine glycosylase II
MLLMFCLGRKDVFPLEDYGIRQSMIRHYGLKETVKRELDERFLRISSAWSPYRTYACLHLWRARDSAK